MKILIDLDENVYTRLFDNGIELSKEDNELIQIAIREGFTEDLSELHKAIGYNEGYTQALKDTSISKGNWICVTASTFLQYQPNEYKCSICSYISHIRHSFCPNCGADMRGGK